MNIVADWMLSKERLVGDVTVGIRFVNHVDEVLSASGIIPLDEVRAVTLAGVLVDTGATTLCLPAEIIRRLGVPKLRDVAVKAASGARTFALYGDVTIDLLGRASTTQCFELPEGATPRLGRLPMQGMGLEPDLANRTIRLLPEEGPETFWLVY